MSFPFPPSMGLKMVRHPWNRTAHPSRARTYLGVELKMAIRHPVQIFFVGVGGDVDLQIGRMLAEAAGAQFQGVTQDALAAALEAFSGYF